MSEEYTDTFGREYEAAEKVFQIDREAPPALKSKDTLEVRYDRKASDEHFSTEWLPTAAVYQVKNLSSKDSVHEYTVAFYRSRSGELFLASCNCVSRLCCKHIARAFQVHTTAEEAGFLPKI